MLPVSSHLPTIDSWTKALRTKPEEPEMAENNTICRWWQCTTQSHLVSVCHGHGIPTFMRPNGMNMEGTTVAAASHGPLTQHRLCFSARTRLLLCQSFFLLLASVAFQPQLPPSLRLLLSLLSASSRVLHRISATNPFNMANPPPASHHTAQSCFPCSTPPIYFFFLDARATHAMPCNIWDKA
jgi:hypothetical protein